MPTPLELALAQLPKPGPRIGGSPAETYRAVAALTAEVGYPGLTARRIARRGGIAPATFWRRYSGIEDCTLRAYDWAVERAANHVAAAPLLPTAPGRERVRHMLATGIDFLVAEPDLAHLLVAGIRTAGAAGRERHRASMDAIALMLAWSLPDAKPIAIEAAMSAAFGIVHQHVLDRRVEQLPHVAGALTELALDIMTGCRPPY